MLIYATGIRPSGDNRADYLPSPAGISWERSSGLLWHCVILAALTDVPPQNLRRNMETVIERLMDSPGRGLKCGC